MAATKRVLAQQDGPCILVAHSYGGAVITEAGTDPSVVGLVYIAAHMPDAGKKESDDGKRFPSDLAKSGAIKRTPDGFTYIEVYEALRSDKTDLLRELARLVRFEKTTGSDCSNLGNSVYLLITWGRRVGEHRRWSQSGHKTGATLQS